MGDFDGTGTFPRLNRALVAGGTPGDVFASAALRGQEYWLARQGWSISTPRPRQQQTTYASYAWRVLFMARGPLRAGLKKIRIPTDPVVGYDGTGGAPDLEWRVTLIGPAGVIAQSAIQGMSQGQGVRTLLLDFAAALETSYGEVLLVVEFKSAVGSIAKSLAGGPGGAPVIGAWTKYGEMVGSTAGAPASPMPGHPSTVFVTYTDVDGVKTPEEIVEVCGPDSQISSPSKFRYPLYKQGEGGEFELGVGYLSHFTLKSYGVAFEFEPAGSSPFIITYPLSRMAPHVAFRGEDVSVHAHNATGLWERNPIWRGVGLPGATAVTSDTETVLSSRWTAMRVQKQGNGTAAVCRSVCGMPGPVSRVRLTLDLLAFYLPAPGKPRATSPVSVPQTLAMTVRLFQYDAGSFLLQTRAIVTQTLRIDFQNPAHPEAHELIHQLGQQFSGNDLGAVQGVDWRDGLATLEDLLRADTLSIDLDGSGVKANDPLIVEVEFELDTVIQGPDLSAWILPVSRCVHVLRGPFSEGSPSAAAKRMAKSYDGFAARETGRGQGIDVEDWAVWPDLNHRTWSHGGWSGEGVGTVSLVGTSFVQTGELARFASLLEPLLNLGGTYKLRVRMAAYRAQVRLTVTTRPGNVTTTYLITQSAASLQYAEVVITLPDAGKRSLTLEARSTDTSGIIYALVPVEPPATESNL